jgi:hypothetical protein
LAIREKSFGPNHPEVAPTLFGIAKLYRKTGRDKEADELEKKASTILKQCLSSIKNRSATEIK